MLLVQTAFHRNGLNILTLKAQIVLLKYRLDLNDLNDLNVIKYMGLHPFAVLRSNTETQFKCISLDPHPTPLFSKRERADSERIISENRI